MAQKKEHFSKTVDNYEKYKPAVMFRKVKCMIAGRENICCNLVTNRNNCVCVGGLRRSDSQWSIMASNIDELTDYCLSFATLGTEIDTYWQGLL